MTKAKRNVGHIKSLRYYSINFHRFWIIVYMGIAFFASVALLTLLIRGIFAVYQKIDFLDLDGSGDLSYLADFLGGMIGVLVGFAMESMFISRLHHLKRYKALISSLNPELLQVKKVVEVNWNYNIMRKRLAELMPDDTSETDRVKRVLKLFSEYKSTSDKEYQRIVAMLRKYFDRNSAFVAELKEKYGCNISECKRIDNLVIFFGTKRIFDENCFNNLRIALDFYLEIEPTDLIVPITDELVASHDSMSILYNLPRWLIFVEKKGNIARKIREIYYKISVLTRRYNTWSWQDLLDCHILLEDINTFLSVTSKDYQRDLIDVDDVGIHQTEEGN